MKLPEQYPDRCQVTVEHSCHRWENYENSRTIKIHIIQSQVVLMFTLRCIAAMTIVMFSVKIMEFLINWKIGSPRGAGSCLIDTIDLVCHCNAMGHCVTLW